MALEMISLVRRFAVAIDNGRRPADVVRHMAGEVDELGDEIGIAAGGGRAGADGIVGETVDVMVCAVDLVVVAAPDVSDDELAAAVATFRKDGPVPLTARFARIVDLVDAQRFVIEKLTGEAASLAGAAEITAACLDLLAEHAPEMDDARMLDVAEAKLEKWKLHYSDGVVRKR